MSDSGYNGPLYNNKTHAIKVRTGDDILNAAKDAVCGELMVAKGGQFPGLYIATKTSGDDVELCRISETIPENKLPIDHDYSLKFLEGDHLDLNSTMAATGEFTLSFWIKPLEDPGSVNPWVIYGENNEYIAWYGPNSGNKLLVGGMGSITSSTNSLIVDNWHHVFLVRNSNDTIELFINGSSEGTSAFSGSIGFNKIGWTSYNLRGLWDEFAFWDSDQSENFSAIYNNGNPVDLSFYSPTHWWRMGDAEGGTGLTITDQGSGGNDATFVNGPTFSPNTPFSTHCIHFDKTNDYLDLGDLSPLVGAKETLSYSLWFKVHDTSNTQGILGNTTGGANSLFGELYYHNGYAAVNHFSKNHPVNISGIIQDTWYHLVVTFNRGETYYYLNGTEKAHIPYSYILTTKTLSTLYSTLKLGRCDRFNQEGNVSLDEFALFEQELSPTDITEIYNSGYPKSLHKYYPIGWWRMGDTEGGTGTTIADLGSGGNDGTLVNSPSFSNQTPSNTGPFNRYSLEFNGTDHSLSTDLSVGGKSALTVSAWVNMSTIQPSGFVQQYAGVGTNRTFRIIYASGGFWFQCYTPEGITEATVTNAAPPTNQWIHLVGTFDGATARIYVDNAKGTDGTTLTSTTLYSASSNVEIGGSSALGWFTDGLIDEVAIWDVALTNNERDYLYNNGKPGHISSLQPLGWWRMGDTEGGTGSTITDLGSGGNDGTINGATFSTDTPSI